MKTEAKSSAIHQLTVVANMLGQTHVNPTQIQTQLRRLNWW